MVYSQAECMMLEKYQDSWALVYMKGIKHKGVEHNQQWGGVMR